MHANTVIHSIDTSKGECVISLYDNDVLIYDKVNVGIASTGNTTSTISMVSDLLRQYRDINFKI
jgi:hypothetical protein